MIFYILGGIWYPSYLIIKETQDFISFLYNVFEGISFVAILLFGVYIFLGTTYKFSIVDSLSLLDTLGGLGHSWQMWVESESIILISSGSLGFTSTKIVY